LVYKNFEKNCKIYRTTWSGDAEVVKPTLDAASIAARAGASPSSAAIQAEAIARAVAIVVASTTTLEQHRMLQQERQNSEACVLDRGLLRRHRLLWRSL
jgi:hypothetical protein